MIQLVQVKVILNVYLPCLCHVSVAYSHYECVPPGDRRSYECVVAFQVLGQVCCFFFFLSEQQPKGHMPHSLLCFVKLQGVMVKGTLHHYRLS